MHCQNQSLLPCENFKKKTQSIFTIIIKRVIILFTCMVGALDPPTLCFQALNQHVLNQVVSILIMQLKPGNFQNQISNYMVVEPQADNNQIEQTIFSTSTCVVLAVFNLITYRINKKISHVPEKRLRKSSLSSNNKISKNTHKILGQNF